MRRFITAVFMISVALVNVTLADTLAESSFTKQSLSQTPSVDEGWVFIVEVTLTKNVLSITAKLYVREIGKSIIYRVEYKGEYYAVGWDDESKTYCVTINEIKYKCNIPATSDETKTVDDSPTKFVGKWAIGNNGWLVDISFINGRYSFYLNPDIIEDVVDYQETSNGIVYTYVEKFDHRSELNKKGWRYYYDDRDNNADPGYPTSGRYEYDRTVVYYTESISLSGEAPLCKKIKMQSFYYLGTALTYADTDTDFSLPGYTRELIPY